MSIPAIVGRGFGSFGGVAFVPTRGFTAGDEAPPSDDPVIVTRGGILPRRKKRPAEPEPKKTQDIVSDAIDALIAKQEAITTAKVVAEAPAATESASSVPQVPAVAQAQQPVPPELAAAVDVLERQLAITQQQINNDAALILLMAV